MVAVFFFFFFNCSFLSAFPFVSSCDAILIMSLCLGYRSTHLSVFRGNDQTVSRKFLGEEMIITIIGMVHTTHMPKCYL